ncbi:NAD(P)/FAD-dependent oxidoreductase [Vulcanisaeta distributa]|uniref:FAD dependent oxidoreductase n=1 Tax=Vulcanisaeta distributa (strain DSM 14429 / JCM 11212 / NBRC 100878 / IC-017) TaxID=572478 RepID=E1QUQ2_VULDI|nr:FAD-binding oxidoreductase [Vulcanisaeta distributa]ADN51171.1 FAD dependent oxidoreductase [Vulcanisaeta distributa DSM 14429]
MDKTFDVVVIGAGSTGATTAYYLAQEGFRVLVVDKRGIAQGMTAYSLGLVRSYYANEDVARMSHYSHGFFMNFEREFGTGVFTKTGLLVIGNDEASMRRTFDMLRSIGARVRLLGSDEIREMLNASVAWGEAGIYEEDAGYVDTGLYTNTVMNRARELGVEFVIDEAQVKFEGNEVVGVRLINSGEVIRANHYVIATNVWTQKLLPQLNLPIKNIIERVIRVEIGRSLPNVFDYVNNFYIRPEGSSYGLMGLLYPPEDAWPDPDDFNPLAEPEFDYAVNVMENAAKRMPWFTNAKYLGGWRGLYDVTPDWMPIIDEPIRDLIVVVGLSGHGFKLAPAFALMVTELIKYGKVRTFRDIFRLSRFREGRLIQGTAQERAAF